MTKSLILSGSLAEKGVLRILKSPLARNAVVVEFDTHINRALLPHAGTIQWLSLPDLLTKAQAAALDRQTREILACYLREHPRSGDRPGDSCLRKACFKWRDAQIILSYLLNHQIAREVLSRHTIGTIIAAPGAGLNLACWRRMAAMGNHTLRELPVEVTGPTIGRRIEKRLYAAKRTPSAPAPAPSPRDETTAREFTVLCTSKRLGRILQAAEPSPVFRLCHASLADLGPLRTDDFQSESAFFANWQQQFEADMDRRFPGLPEGCSDAISLVAGSYVSEIYPSYSSYRKNAAEHLRKCMPSMILSDTQTGSLERVWDLAARDLGIPIISFTYDHLVDRETALIPDYLISDSGRNTSVAITRGFPAPHVFEIASFRKPAETPPPPRKNELPLVLFADNYFAMLSAEADPRAALGQYQQIVAAARLLPDVRFVIKFHPLRSKKTELLSFIGMDEAELRVRKRFIRSLDPPRNLRLAPPEESMQSLLSSANVLLNTISQAGHEAFQLGVPVIFLEEPDSDGLVFPRFNEFLPPSHATDAGTLARQIEQLLSDPVIREDLVRRQRLYLDQFYWRSSVSLTSAIERILEHHSARHMPDQPG